MALPNRLFALAGCALIATACTQDTTTAPPITAEVGIEAVPTYFGEEYGTLTFVKNRQFPSWACNLKVSLKGLWDDPEDAGEYYYVRAGTSSNIANIPDEEISRGTFRGVFNEFNYLAHGSSDLYLVFISPRLGVSNATLIGTATQSANPDFTIVNRCF